MTIDRSRFSKQRPRVEPSDLDGEAAILTIAGVEELMIPREGKEEPEPTLTLTTQEVGDKVIYLNVTMIDSLIAMLGDDETKWPGQKIAVEVYTPKFGAKAFPDKVGVVSSTEWPEYFKQAKLPLPGASAKSLKVVQGGKNKKGGKR